MAKARTTTKRTKPAGARRTQEQRTREMRERLMEATVLCLAELGYARTTTTAVIERAGVSRGAQLHHFPTKKELVTTAVEYVMQKRNEAFLRAFADASADDLADQMVDRLWSIFSGPTFYAWLELLVAARTDPALKEAVDAIAGRFTASVDETFKRVVGLPDDGALSVAPAFTFLVLEGLALEKTRALDPGLERRILKALKALAPLALASARAREPT